MTSLILGNLLDLRSLHPVLLPHLLPGKLLYGREALALRSVTDKKEDDGHSEKPRSGGEEEAVLPSERTYHEADDYE